MKQHKILDKNIVLGTIMLLIIAAIPITILPAFDLSGTSLSRFLGVLGAIIALLIFNRIFKGEFQGFIKCGDSRTGIKLAMIMIIYYIYLVCQMLICGKFASPTIMSFAAACAAGCLEETIFRGYLISFLLRHKNNMKAIPRVLVTSMVLFGLVHLANITRGAAVGITVMQVIGATGMGALFAAVYMRSGNLLIVMVMHGLTDLFAFMDSSQTAKDGLMVAHVSFINYVDVTICIGLCIVAFYLIRPTKRSEIIDLWNKKWNRK